MLVFDTARPARFSACIDFSRHSFANLSFFAQDGLTIPYHLSLRHDTGLAVSNRRGPHAADWGREQHRPMHCGQTAQLELRFEPPGLEVRLDGKRLFSFGRRWPRQRWPGLDTIRMVEATGGLIPASLDLNLAAGTKTLTLDTRLELRSPLPKETDVTLRAGDLVLSAIRDTSSGQLRARLPGRVWRGRSPDDPIDISLCAGPRCMSALRLDRHILANQIIPLLTTGALRRDPALLARVVEQIHFAECQDLLPTGAQHELSRLAASAGLDGFFTPAAKPASSSDPASSPSSDILNGALARVAQALRTDQTMTPDWADLLTPPKGSEIPFFLSLADPFCQRDQLDLLWQQADMQAMRDIATNVSIWQDSAALPFLLKAGRTAEIAPILQRMARNTTDWITTAPAAWTITQVLSHSAGPEQTSILCAFLRFVTAQARDYWGRSPCQALIRAGVAMLKAAPDLNPKLGGHIQRRVLHAWGLSRDFWEEVKRTAPALGPQAKTAQDYFDRLTSPNSHMAQKSEALAYFDTLGCPDVARLRQEMLGPSGLTPPEQAPSPAALLAAGLDPGHALLRHMAWPKAAPPTPDALPYVRRAVPQICHTFIPVSRSAQADQEDHTMKAALAALDAPDPTAALQPLLTQLRALSTAETGWSGFGIGLNLALELHRRNVTAPPLNAALENLAKQALKRADIAQLANLPAHTAPLAQLPLRDGALGQLAAAAPPALPQATPAGHANALFDTLVMVFSCRAHLTTRIPALREAWLNRLTALGVPYVILTGDGDNRLEGNHLQLDVPDDYEGLPQKTLGAIRWCIAQTSYAHLLKIDDDCFLNTEAFFHAFSHRKADYYGRILSRLPGDLDRSWHCGKSTTTRGRFELDTSPEPSEYCDGGSGYALSRRAMQAALRAAETPAGQALITGSFMEDKLLGDLLSLEGIHPANEGYDVTLRRRATPQGRPVPRWANGFDPSAAAPVKLIHLDDPDAQVVAAQTLSQSVLTPKKLWPSYQPARLGENSNALELLSPPGRIRDVQDAPVTVTTALRNERPLLPHFLAHYRALGVESFAVADNGSDDGSLEYLADQPDVALFSVDTDYNKSQYGVAWQQTLMANLRPGRWSLVADADEFLVCGPEPGQGNLPHLLAAPEFDTADAVRLFMLDLYPKGPLDQADFTQASPFDVARFTDRTPLLNTALGRGPFSNAPTWTSAVRHRLFPGSRPELFVAQKIALLKYAPWHRLSAGLHYVAGTRLAKRELFLAHFKYDARFHAKARTEVARGQHFNAAEEYRAYLGLFADGAGTIFDPDLSIPWQDAPFVRERMRPFGSI